MKNPLSGKSKAIGKGLVALGGLAALGSTIADAVSARTWSPGMWVVAVIVSLGLGVGGAWALRRDDKTYGAREVAFLAPLMIILAAGWTLRVVVVSGWPNAPPAERHSGLCVIGGRAAGQDFRLTWRDCHPIPRGASCPRASVEAFQIHPQKQLSDDADFETGRFLPESTRNPGWHGEMPATGAAGAAFLVVLQCYGGDEKRVQQHRMGVYAEEVAEGEVRR